MVFRRLDTSRGTLCNNRCMPACGRGALSRLNGFRPSFANNFGADVDFGGFHLSTGVSFSMNKRVMSCAGV